MNFLGNFRRFGVEIITFLFFFSWHMTYTCSQTYLNVVVGHSPKADVCRNNITRKELYNQERHAVRLSLKLSLVELLPVIPITIFLAIRSDMNKRRWLMILLPFVGNSIFCCFYAVHHYYSDQIFLLYFGNLGMALGGHMYMFQAGVHSRIGDRFKPNERLFQMACQESCIQFAMGTGIFFGGLWLKYLSYQSFFYAAIIFSILCLPLARLLIKEDENDTENMYKQIDTREWRNVFCQFKYWIIFISFQLFIFVHNGEERIRILYFKNKPLCFTSLIIGLNGFLLGIVAGIGTAGIVYILTKIGVRTVWIGMVGFGSKIVGSIFMGFANTLAIVIFGK